jgi:hypothetical protein
MSKNLFAAKSNFKTSNPIRPLIIVIKEVGDDQNDKCHAIKIKSKSEQDCTCGPSGSPKRVSQM